MNATKRIRLYLIALPFIFFIFFTGQVFAKSFKPWSFGIMGDTQWTPSVKKTKPYVWGYDPHGENPNSVSVSIIRQINREMIEKGVKFVIQVGDITNTGTDEGIATRAEAAEELYNAGIGFFCMRGNHETYINFYYPKMKPNGFAIPAMQKHFPQHRGEGENVFEARNFSSPVSNKPGLENMSTELSGLSYAFDYGDEDSSATFVILDPWATKTKIEKPKGLFVNYGYSIAEQQAWIDSRLDKNRRQTEHAFVFSHQPLMAANHIDTPFGYADERIEAQNTFYKSMVKAGAYFIAGHDHLHHRNLIKSPNGQHAVEELISAPACPKFYASKPDSAKGWRGQKSRATTISQETKNIGFYIFTVEGPNVIVDYFSDSKGNFSTSGRWPDGTGSLVTPAFKFTKKETWLISTVGKTFYIAQGAPYTVVEDNYNTTSVKIAAGVNESDGKDDLKKPLTKRVSTGWLPGSGDLSSNILLIEGMTDLGKMNSDRYLLAMSDQTIRSTSVIKVMEYDGEWFDVGNMIIGGTSRYVEGPPSDKYELGTYGWDSATHTAWAVVNFTGRFALARK